MKSKLIITTTIRNRYNLWMIHFLPALFLRRDDVFDDEAAYYLGMSWLIFQMYVRIRIKKKQEDKHDYVGPATDCEQ